MSDRKIPRNKYANQAVDFINLLTGTNDYSDKPFKLRKWQEEYVRNLFGHVDKNGERIYKKSFVFLPRGNGKTSLLASIILYALCCWPAGQQIYSCASDREQAGLIFRTIKQMIGANPDLAEICDIHDTTKRITIASKHSFYAATSADAHRLHGLSPSLCVYDEMHCAKNADLLEAMQTGLNKRKNSLFIGITTAGVYDPAGQQIAQQEYEYAKRALEQPKDYPHYLPVIYEASPDDDWTDPKVWAKANPALNDFLPIEGIADECKIAQELPARESAFKRYHLNIFSQSVSKWLSSELWQECGNTKFAIEDLKGKECYAGLDLAPVRDLSSLTLLFPFEDGSFKVLSYNWCCEQDIVTRSKRDKAPYDLWAEQGYLTTTPGSSTDFDFIRADINSIADQFSIKTIAADPFNCAQLGQQLTEQDGINVEWFRQGFLSQSPPTQRLEKWVIDKVIHHQNNPVLAWCAGNACTETDAAGNIKVSKKKSTEKIDAIAALINAIGAYLIYENQPVEQPSVYETQGISFF